MEFDNKTESVIVWNGLTVMSRTEEPYFRKLFELLAERIRVHRVLEVGYGLGISARLIQQHLRPIEHHIVEIEANIHADLIQFARAQAGVFAHPGDWASASLPRNDFDFIFYDPFEYLPSQRLDKESEGRRLAKLLAPHGLLCHSHFGDGPPRELPGFSTEILARFTVPPISMADGTACQDVAVVAKRVDVR